MTKILIIEDSPDLVFIYRELLEDCELKVSLDQGEIASLIDQVDLVICDYHFSDVLSFEMVKEMVGSKKPLILCSGEDDKVALYGGLRKMDMYKGLKPRIVDLLKGVS